MKECELCDLPARMYCESDQASLCWDCDAKVHGANFLVARHIRNLLCQVCQSPTPWKASGAKLGSTVSVCERCVDSCNGRQEEEQDEGGDEEDDDDDDDDDDGDEEDEDIDDDDDGGDGYVDGDGDEEDGDNQVVPLSSSPPPPVASSSSSEESSSRICNGGGGSSEAVASSLKRMRENVDLESQGDLDCSYPQSTYKISTSAAVRTFEDEASSVDPSRPPKDRKKTGALRPALADVAAAGTTSALVVSLKRLQQNKYSESNDAASATILDICKLSKDPQAVDLISTGSQSRLI